MHGLDDIVRILACQAGVLRRDTRTIGAVAAGAGGNLAVRQASAVNAFAQGHGILALGKAQLARLAGQPVRDIAHIAIREASDHALHHGIAALAALEFFQLLDEVFGVLLRQLGIDGNGRIAICIVASRADGGVAGLAFHQIRLGSFGCGLRCRKCRNGRKSQYSSRQQGGDQLHIEGLYLVYMHTAGTTGSYNATLDEFKNI
ncbi:hypothetical protein D3C72_1148510 [compost metagenome]